MTTASNSDSDRLERIERLLEKIATEQTAMKSIVAILTQDMDMMQGHMSLMQHDMRVMRRDMGTMQDNTGVMQRDMSVMQDNLDMMQHNMGVMQGNIGIMQHDMGVMQGQMSVTQRDMAVMKGWQTELVVERQARRVFRRLCGGDLLRVYPDMELQHYLNISKRAGAMSGDEVIRAEAIDFLLEGAGPEGTAVMYAVEVSYNIGVDDSDRAIDKADLLSRVLGREVKPAVVGEVSTAQFEADAASRNVAYTYIGNGRDITR